MERLIPIINSFNHNSQHYGKNCATPRIEYRCPQLVQQFHASYLHYCKLIDVLYSNKGGDSHEFDHVNPYDPSQKLSDGTISNHWWASDYKSGKIPKLTPHLKLFFASPHIANGEWIQFHGPGTDLYDVDPRFVLYHGSLCDPNKRGEFTSKSMFGELTEHRAYTKTSPYRISIKWE